MIKVGREYSNNSYEHAKLSVDNSFDNSNLQNLQNIEAQINFYTSDFLDLNQQKKGLIISQPETIDLYKNAISLLEDIFKLPVFLFQDEKVAHFNILNEIIAQEDVVIIDQFVSANLYVALKELKRKGVQLFYIAHNKLDQLEDILIQKRTSTTKIWYFAQGIYPVPGNTLPVERIKTLLEEYTNFFLYVTDSDSLGWTGENGCGFICQNFHGLKKVFMVSSLIKGFGASGGVVFITGEFGLNIKTEQPSFIMNDCLSSIIYSSNILLSKDIETLQSRLRVNTKLFQTQAQRYSLPVLSNKDLPTVYMAAGVPVMCGEICSDVLNDGIFLSSSCFPQMPINCSGLKINITLRHSHDQIKELIFSLKNAYEHILRKRNITITNILTAYQKDISVMKTISDS